ncbi:hypothetical protein FF1_035321 [Malus domestica]
MESLSMILSFSPPPQNHAQTQKPLPSPPISLPQTTTTPAISTISTSQAPNTSHTQFPSTKNIPHTPMLPSFLGIFDGISIKVAELLFKHGFKEAYAIKGGVGGTKWWLESQETLLPPSMHIYPKKKVKTSQETVTNTGVVRGKVESNGAATSTNLSTGESQTTDNGRTTKATDSVSLVKNGSRSSSPCPSYQDLKPPSSPTPSKP